jgi:predicted acyl esterase
MGWLRASHRRLDPLKSKSYKPYHTHDTIELLEPLKIYPFEIEILPSSLIFPKGYSLALTISGNDFIVQPPGRILHNDPNDRTSERFDGQITIFSGNQFPSQLLMPLIPFSDIK